MMILFVNENFAQNTTILRPRSFNFFQTFYHIFIITLWHRYFPAEIIMALMVDSTDESKKNSHVKGGGKIKIITKNETCYFSV